MTINLNEEDIRTLAIACKEHAAIVRLCKELELGNYTLTDWRTYQSGYLKH